MSKPELGTKRDCPECGARFYDLTKDPEEKNNLAGRSNVAERLQEFRSLLESKQKEAAARR